MYVFDIKKCTFMYQNHTFMSFFLSFVSFSNTFSFFFFSFPSLFPPSNLLLRPRVLPSLFQPLPWLLPPLSPPLPFPFRFPALFPRFSRPIRRVYSVSRQRDSQFLFSDWSRRNSYCFDQSDVDVVFAGFGADGGAALLARRDF